MGGFVMTTAISKILNMQSRKKIIQGGTSASKTFGTLAILIQKAITSRVPIEISVVSESTPHLRRGAIKDFLKLLEMQGMYSDAQWNRTTLKYTFDNKSYMEFFSVEQGDKLRGARRNVLYVNEANNVPYEAYQQLSIRTDGDIYIDFNPTNRFWAHTKVLVDADAELIILTYKDNEALSENIVKEIEMNKVKAETSAYYKNWWNVYGLGQIGSIEGACIKEYDTIDSVPAEAELLGVGLDFGYTNDPTAIVTMYKYNGGYIYDEIAYKTNLLNGDIVSILKINNLQNELIIADSSEPKSIAQMNQLIGSNNVLGVTKGKDSIVNGIALINQNKITVTRNSTNLISELQNYVWLKDREGNTINKPIDKYNHIIDAMRYITMHKLGNPNYGTYHIL